MYSKRDILFVSLMLLSMSIHSAGLWDQGLVSGATRSDYGPGIGTGRNLLTLHYVDDNVYNRGPEGCKFATDKSIFGCPGTALGNYRNFLSPEAPIQERKWCGGSNIRIGDSYLGCLSYRTSPYFSANNPGSNHWVVVANEEPAFDQCRIGPPGLSNEIVSDRRSNLNKVIFQDLPWGAKRVHLMLNHSQHNFYCKGNRKLTLPFLSFGAQYQRGNPQPLGVINSNPNRRVRDQVRFAGWLPRFLQEPFLPVSEGGVHGGIYVIAKWGGIRRLVFLDLFQSGVMQGLKTCDDKRAPDCRSRWNWPVKDSFLYPGGDMALLSVNSNELRSCGINIPTLSSNLNIYKIDLSKLFKCVSDNNMFDQKMPNNRNINVLGVHWYIESQGETGKVDIALQGIRMMF